MEANTPYFRTQVQFNIYLSCKFYLSHLQMQCALLKGLVSYTTEAESQ